MEPRLEFRVLLVTSIVSVAVAQTDSSADSCAQLTPSTARRFDQDRFPLYRARPAVENSSICASDPVFSATDIPRFVVNVIVRNERCQPLVGVAVQVEQADAGGMLHEREDCGGRFVTDENGRYCAIASAAHWPCCQESLRIFPCSSLYLVS